MSDIRFGVLGLSPGNGHPYSWSAICNGYDPLAMATCPFPAIPAYLARQSFPQDRIGGVRVTHVWTQDTPRSAHIAAAALIPTVVDAPQDMIGQVDAILLARDDAQNHAALAAPFLEAGLPIYIDKPLALSRREGEALYARQARAGQIFSCTALAYASEFRLDAAARDRLRRLRYVEGSTPKHWDTYAIHVIEPLMQLLSQEGPIVDMVPSARGVQALDLRWASGVEGRVRALGAMAAPIEIRLFGEAGWVAMVFEDSFAAFRAALQHFTDIVAGRAPPQDPDGVLAVIDVIEAGRVPR